MKRLVLDHGYVQLVECWGTGTSTGSSDFERGIIEAARQSTQGAFRGWELDQRLLTYLYKHKHATPFEFAGMVIEVQAPLFVFREWHRHRTQSYNEMSARYSPLPELYYLPRAEDVYHRADIARRSANAQAGVESTNTLTMKQAHDWVESLRNQYETFETQYREALANGVPKELARVGMPVGHYSRMRASASLRNWLAFMTLRMDPAAQFEIRRYAIAVSQLVAEQFPRTYELFREC